MPRPKHHRRDDAGWGSTNFRKPRPPGLRGRNIGLFYRDQQLMNKNPELSINLKVPRLVISKLKSNLNAISQMSHELDNKICINMTKLKQESLPNKSYDPETKEPDFKHIKLEHKDVPSTSTSTQDFIPLKSKKIDDEPGENVLNLRMAGEYKYGYNDIITGTFDEKLEENIAKGINITRMNNDVASLNISLYENHLYTVSKTQYISMMKFRETLPTYKKRAELLDLINKNQVVVISGETGCGKSTQVPQLILDEAIMNKKGGNIKILVTQPRRIAASSLAARVASERAEAMGASVGYAVRLEKKDCRARGSIMFCTTGILLVDLETNQALGDYSHVILDEVHERDFHIDFAMCMLKQVLQKRKDLKLILMSATLDADRLCGYFNDTPMVHIEGLAFPVKDVYLEEILEMTKYRLPAAQPPPTHAPLRGYQRHLRRNKEMMRDISEKAIQYRAFIGPWLEPQKRKLDPIVHETLLDPRIEDLNMDLIFEVIKQICRKPPGAILVFLPGISEITKLMRIIYDRGSTLGTEFELHPLHSKLPTIEQNKIFQRPPDHIRKIIIATNIAETSITIDDIVYVVDCGKIKYTGLNVEQHFSTLKTEWESKANMRQRRGRAGRCQPGICYHLITSHRAASLEERHLPEMQRSDLLEPVLMCKRLRLGKATDALKMVPDPPVDTTIDRAVNHLRQCGSLDENETLTPLGWHLARLPLHPAAGKLLLLGSLFGCLDRAASVAAVWSFKDPFMLIIDKEDQVKAAKRTLAMGEPSDHVALSEAIIQWEQCSSHERRSFAYDYFLSQSTLELLSDMKRQLCNNLKQMGFLGSGSVSSSWENRNSDNLSLFKAIVAASLYPNITSARWVNLNARNPNKQVKVYPRTPEGRATIHPSSILSPPKRKSRFPPPKVALCSNPGANWLVYWLKQKSSELFLIDITLVYTLPLIFFGELKVSESEDNPNICTFSITSFKVQVQKETAQLLFELRALLDEVLASKIMVSSSHSTRHSQFEEQVLSAVIAVITAEDERAEYLEGSESDVSDYDNKY